MSVNMTIVIIIIFVLLLDHTLLLYSQSVLLLLGLPVINSKCVLREGRLMRAVDAAAAVAALLKYVV